MREIKYLNIVDDYLYYIATYYIEHDSPKDDPQHYAKGKFANVIIRSKLDGSDKKELFSMPTHESNNHLLFLTVYKDNIYFSGTGEHLVNIEPKDEDSRLDVLIFKMTNKGDNLKRIYNCKEECFYENIMDTVADEYNSDINLSNDGKFLYFIQNHEIVKINSDGQDKQIIGQQKDTSNYAMFIDNDEIYTFIRGYASSNLKDSLLFELNYDLDLDYNKNLYDYLTKYFIPGIKLKDGKYDDKDFNKVFSAYNHPEPTSNLALAKMNTDGKDIEVIDNLVFKEKRDLANSLMVINNSLKTYTPMHRCVNDWDAFKKIKLSDVINKTDQNEDTIYEDDLTPFVACIIDLKTGQKTSQKIIFDSNNNTNLYFEDKTYMNDSDENNEIYYKKILGTGNNYEYYLAKDDEGKLFVYRTFFENSKVNEKLFEFDDN